MFGKKPKAKLYIPERPKIYSRDWVRSVSYEEYDREMEKLRKLWKETGDDRIKRIRDLAGHYRAEYEHELWLQKYPEMEGHVYYSEHGHHLPEGDD
mgnify:CR=1 FL=1